MKIDPDAAVEYFIDIGLLEPGTSVESAAVELADADMEIRLSTFPAMGMQAVNATMFREAWGILVALAPPGGGWKGIFRAPPLVSLVPGRVTQSTQPFRYGSGERHAELAGIPTPLLVELTRWSKANPFRFQLNEVGDAMLQAADGGLVSNPGIPRVGDFRSLASFLADVVIPDDRMEPLGEEGHELREGLIHFLGRVLSRLGEREDIAVRDIFIRLAAQYAIWEEEGFQFEAFMNFWEAVDEQCFEGRLELTNQERELYEAVRGLAETFQNGEEARVTVIMAGRKISMREAARTRLSMARTRLV